MIPQSGLVILMLMVQMYHGTVTWGAVGERELQMGLSLKTALLSDPIAELALWLGLQWYSNVSINEKQRFQCPQTTGFAKVTHSSGWPAPNRGDRLGAAD